MTLDKTIPLLIVFLLVGAISGCQGSGGTESLVGAPQAGITPGTTHVETAELPQGMPVMGGIAEPLDAPRIPASQNNYLKGREAIAVSPTGTEVGIDNLILTSTETEHAWAVWRWGRFADEVVPETLSIWSTVEPGDEYWLFLSEYAAGTWKFIGPMTDGSFTWDYDQPERYLSPGGYTYVALLATRGNVLDVQNLNILADRDVTPPSTPAELSADYIGSTSVRLNWKVDESNGLRRYNIYQGPSPSFDLDDEGVSLVGNPESFMFQWPVGNLTPETDYAFCLTLTDMVGNESLNSNFANITTLPMPHFDAPDGLTVIDVGSSWVDLAWLPVVPEPLGYNAFTGPVSGFNEGGSGVTLRNHGLIESTIWRMTDLAAETEYHIGVQAYHQEGVSDVSNTVNITTLASTPPVPAFIYTPDPILAGVQATLDPSTTTDADTPLNDLVFKWDFDEDGIIDVSTIGPQEVTWMFNRRGMARVALTVSDGTAVTIYEDILIQMRYDYTEVAQAAGVPARAVAIDTNPPAVHALSLLEIGDGHALRYFDGAVWTTYSLDSITADHFCDVALGPNTLMLLTADFDGSTVAWDVHEFDLSTWTTRASDTQNADAFSMGRLEVSADDRLAIGIVAAQDVASVLEYHVYAWHELSDGSLDQSDTLIGTGITPVMDVQRSSTESSFLYCKDGDLRIWTIDDSSSTDAAVQSYTGSPLYINFEKVANDPAKLIWAVATDAERIYFGDNYGDPVESDMFWETEATPNGLLGVAYTGDNASFFAWTESDLVDNQRMVTCAPFPDGTGEPTVWTTGIGAADGGVGAYFIDDTSEGILTLTNETRDGECIGRFATLDDGWWVTDVYSPAGDSNIQDTHQGLILTNGWVMTLAAQEYASARRSVATPPWTDFMSDENGTDCWIIPDTACPTRYVGEYFTAGFTEKSALEVVLNLTYGDTGQSKLTIPFVSDAVLAYNPFSTDTALCYVTNSGRDVMVRYWGGIEWSDPVLIFNSANTIDALEFVGKKTFNWAAAFIDSAGNTWLSESNLTDWLPARLMSSEAVDPAVGLGLDYHTDGRCVIAHYRTDTEPGVYIGVAELSGPAAWERVVEPAGTGFTSLEAYFHHSHPLVVYYQEEAAVIDGRMHFVEYADDAWTDTELPDQIHGNPVDSSRDVMGNIVFAGYRIDGASQRAVCGVLYR